MAEDVVIARFQADLDQVRGEFEAYIKELNKVQGKEKETQEDIKKTGKTAETSAQKRSAAIKTELNEIARLRKARNDAFQPKAIDEFNKKISESQRRIQLLKGEAQGVGSSIKGVFANFAAGIAAAASTQAIINLAQQSIHAFLEAEENANKLKFAITQIGNESEEVFERLIDQSARLQKQSIFSDDSIQQAQTMLATFGLTGAQIELLLPRLADFATVTRQDIVSAANAVGAGLQGAGREFKKFGIDVNASATELENLNAITDGFAKLQGAAAKETETLTGQLKQQENAVDDLQEALGEELAPAWVAVKKAVFEATLTTIEFFKQGGNLALALLKREVKDIPGAFEEVTKKVDEQTKKLIAVGFDENTARKEAIKNIRAEINERLALAIDKAKAAQNDASLDGLQKQRIANRLSGIRNEINAIKQLADQFDELHKVDERALKLSDLKQKSLEELNQLLKENDALSDIVSQSNVKVINIEIAARKKQSEELEKELAKQLEALKKLYGDVKKIPPITLKVNFEKEEIKPINDVPDQIQLPPPDDTAFNDGLDRTLERMLDKFFAAYGEVVAETEALVGELINVWSQYDDIRIEKIQKQTDEQIDALDAQSQANEESLDKRRISEKEFQQAQAEIEANKVKAQEQADKKIRDIKRREFNVNKIAALAEITIETAKKVTEAPILLKPYYAGFGLAQAAIVIAQPNPYKKGTKAAKQGMAWVDEEGKEVIVRKPSGPGRLTTLEKNDKVVPFRQSVKHEKVFDAIVDDRLENYIHHYYVAPELERQQKKFDRQQQKTFADNISKSFVINTKEAGSGVLNQLATSESIHFLKKISKGNVTISNPGEIADAIVNKTSVSYKR